MCSSFTNDTYHDAESSKTLGSMPVAFGREAIATKRGGNDVKRRGDDYQTFKR